MAAACPEKTDNAIALPDAAELKVSGKKEDFAATQPDVTVDNAVCQEPHTHFTDTHGDQSAEETGLDLAQNAIQTTDVGPCPSPLPPVERRSPTSLPVRTKPGPCALPPIPEASADHSEVQLEGVEMQVHADDGMQAHGDAEMQAHGDDTDKAQPEDVETQEHANDTDQDQMGFRASKSARDSQPADSPPETPGVVNHPVLYHKINGTVVEGSPSLGTGHAQASPAADVDDASGGEQRPPFDSDEDIDAQDAAAAALLHASEHELPCALEGGAHAVDLAPHESPSPLPPGVWDDPESGTSISLPQLHGGGASRDSTPRMFAGGMETSATSVGNQPSARKTPRVAPIADLQKGADKLLSKNRPALATTRGSKQTDDTLKQPRISNDISATDKPEFNEEMPAANRVNAAPPGINFYQGGHTLLQRIRENEPETAAASVPASGNHGKSKIKALQAADRQKAMEQKQAEAREARKKATQDALAAKKAPKSALTDFTVENVVVGKAREVHNAPARSVIEPVKTPERAAQIITDMEMSNVTPTHLRHALASGWKMDPDNFGLKHPTPCKEQYALTPNSQLCSMSEDESGTTKLRRAGKVRPPWAQSDALLRQLKAQRKVNPEKICGTCPTTCDLLDIFGKGCTEDQYQKYTIRRASRDWGPDAVTDAQVQSYNNRKGYRS
eukprot:jgi/Ulvmu1/7873/UM004_0104.1